MQKNCLNLPRLPHMRHSGVVSFVAASFLVFKSLFLNKTRGHLSQSFSNKLEFYTKHSCERLKVVVRNKIHQTPVTFF